MHFSVNLAAVTVVVWVATAAVTCQAATSKAFDVTATIVNGCAVAQAGGSWGQISLGTVSGLATGTVEANLIASGVSGVVIECTPGTSASLSADNGNNAASGQRRLMQAGVATMVPYALFANGSTTAWTTQPLALSFAAGASKQTIPVKASLTLPGALQAGKYTDTLRLTLSW